MAADDAAQAVPSGYEDCGVVVTTSGWPTTTTTPTPTGRADCILKAAADGTLASYTVTGRDHQGGMEGTTYRVDGPELIQLIRYHASAAGEFTSIVDVCAALLPPESPYDEPSCAPTDE